MTQPLHRRVRQLTIHRAAIHKHPSSAARSLGLAVRLIAHDLRDGSARRAATMAACPTRHERLEFTTGFCLELACVLAERTGAPIDVEIANAPDRPSLHHAWIRDANGCAIDINGTHPGPIALTRPRENARVEKDVQNAGVRFGPLNPAGVAWARRIARRCPTYFGLYQVY